VKNELNYQTFSYYAKALKTKGENVDSIYEGVSSVDLLLTQIRVLTDEFNKIKTNELNIEAHQGAQKLAREIELLHDTLDAVVQKLGGYQAVESFYQAFQKQELRQLLKSV
jgi:hypothetical protein